MPAQTGLRDLGRNNAPDWRGIAAKKGAAPPLHRSSAKSVVPPAAVHATFISPPRNTPILPVSNYNSISNASYGSAAVDVVNGAAESENAMVRQGCNACLAKAEYSLTSGNLRSNLDASLPPGGTELLPYAKSAACERGSDLRSVSDVPVLSMGCEEESRRPITVAPMAGLASARGHVCAVPSAPPTPSAFIAAGATAADEIVAAFLSTCVGRVAEAACTPQGKTLLVAALETEREEVLVPVVAEICDALGEVAVDAHGCHVLRTLIEACTAEQTEELMAAMYPSVILNICTTSQHTRLSLQSLFERRLVDLWPVVDVLAANAGYLAATQQGCISLMRVFERCDVDQKSALVHELLPKFAALSKDSYANYMVQCAIEHTDRTTAAQYVVQFFAGHLLQMSCDKFSSNVVEKVVRVCGGVPAVRRLVLDELVYNPAALKELVSDGYGNFVVQSVIEVTTNAMELKRVEDRLRPALVGSPFAAKIEAKLKAKRPGQPHAATNGHHQPQHPLQQPLQQHRPTAYMNRMNQVNVFGLPASVNSPMHQCAPQRSPSYRRPERQDIALMPFTAAAAAAAAAASVCTNNSGSFRHRPYDAQALQNFHDANAQLRNAPLVQVPTAGYYTFQIVQGRGDGDADGAVVTAEGEVEDSGPVYGPSPAARRHLQQQQQQFRPPFNGML
ncbi:unspecified product [Leptomonas pyrrhocoris]|uniref:Unspecified product n=1 Tax=Leptomonas pyrrhocoris TaxID=157538 RepID=A0A0M9FSP1_LEPPY|nr:unspecified product [Leptomonas pyrrhocoris]KPA75233.1 unspecified product [Leptomonas pyrrhocoris]|eukprot:XP_015653672.1 unspecified product [Leptomonas pyrrhocoris]